MKSIKGTPLTPRGTGVITPGTHEVQVQVLVPSVGKKSEKVVETTVQIRVETNNLYTVLRAGDKAAFFRVGDGEFLGYNDADATDPRGVTPPPAPRPPKK